MLNNLLSKIKTTSLLLGCCLALVSKAQETPGKKVDKAILLLNGTAHIGNGEIIKKSAIGIKDGKIILVTDALRFTIKTADFDTIIDLTGKHIYPGFIATNSTLGLMEIESVRATEDFKEIGEFTPNARTLIAFNTDSKIIPTIRTNGILLGQIVPKGGAISGTSSIMHFDGWNWEDAVIKADEGLHLNWPGMFKRSWRSGSVSKEEEYQENKQKVYDYFQKAKAYAKDNQGIIDVEMEAMKAVFTGEKQLYVHASFIREISEVINFKKDFNINKLCIVGGYDAWMEADRLKENNISVLLSRVHSLPHSEDDDVNLPYKLPKILADAGVLFALQNQGDMEQMGTRNLPFYAGTARTYGLTNEQAIQTLTLNPAKIIGIDLLYGSLETQKSATLFVSEGDALDMKTNKVILAFINGISISLENSQERLYKKYKTKYNLE